MAIEMMLLAKRAALPRKFKHILWSIGDYTGPNGEGCWASNKRLAYDSGYSIREVRRLRTQMEELGYLEVVGHSRFGTLITNIVVANIPLLPDFKTWCDQQLLLDAEEEEEDAQQQRALQNARFVANGSTNGSSVPNGSTNGLGDKTPPPTAENVPPSGDFLRKMSPPPVVNVPTFGQNVPPPAENVPPGQNVPPSDDPWGDVDAPVPPQDREPAPEPEYVSVDEEYDPKKDLLPRTPLERLIVANSGGPSSKYITDSIRRKLNTQVMAAQGKAREQKYPSPEQMYRDEPLYHDYVVYRAEKHRSMTGGLNPSRTVLVKLISTYGTAKWGWFDYRDLGKREEVANNLYKINGTASEHPLRFVR